MWEWEFEVLAEKLLDVRTLDVVGGFELDNFEDLRAIISMLPPWPHRLGVTYVDRSETGSVPCCHILVKCIDCFRP